MSGPIRPESVGESKAKQIPEAVFRAVNALIAQKFVNGSAIVKQDDIVVRLEAQGLSRKEILSKNWLDFESAYEAVGWEVVYDKPGYNESYPATFEFIAKGRR